jgi:hypothetical protein
MKTKNMTTLHLRKSRGRSPFRRVFFLIPLVLGCFALSPAARALLPPPTPDGDYPGFNTAEGFGALYDRTTGLSNTAIGHSALTRNTTGGFNTATGYVALSSNVSGSRNTANGFNALGHNTGSDNTATGAQALLYNTTGANNTATGAQALQHNNAHGNTADGFQALENNTNGSFNVAVGGNALYTNTTGSNNTATGDFALASNRTGSHNTATGAFALYQNTGSYNTGVGEAALQNNTTGSNNIALGFAAGQLLTTGSNNIDIGTTGVAGESNVIRIGGTQTAIHFGGNQVYMGQIGSYDASAGVPVYLDANGRLGFGDVCPVQCQPSSERFKDNIKPMDKASEAILALKPVTFRYKKEFKPKDIPQFGLVAEEVQKVNPDLVVRDPQGKPYGVRYDAVNAMLLNEFLKEHKTVQELKKEIAALKAGLQKVSAQVELNKPGQQVVNNP